MTAQKKVDVTKVRLDVATELLDRMNYTGYSEEQEIESMLDLYFEEVVTKVGLANEVFLEIHKEILDKEPEELFTDHSLKVYTHPKYIEARYAVEYSKAVITELYRIKFSIEVDKIFNDLELL